MLTPPDVRQLASGIGRMEFKLGIDFNRGLLQEEGRLTGATRASGA